jgi:hypothetical protein
VWKKSCGRDRMAKVVWLRSHAKIVSAIGNCESLDETDLTKEFKCELW